MSMTRVKKQTSAFFCLLLAFVLAAGLVPVTAMAAETVTLEFEDIGKTIEKQNLTLKILHNSVKTLEAGKTDAWLAQESLEYQLVALKIELAVNEAEYEADQENELLLAKIEALKKQIILLEYQLGTVINQVYASIDSIDANIEKLEKQRSAALNSLIYSAEASYISYFKLQVAKEQIAVQAAEAERSVNSLAARYNLGMISKSVLDSAANQLKTLDDSLRSLERQEKSLIDDIKVTLGYDLKTNLKIGAAPKFEYGSFYSVSYSAGLKEYLANSTKIKDAEKALEDAKEKREDEANTVYDVNRAEVELESAKIDAERAFDKAYNSLRDAYEKLEDTEEKLEDAQTESLNARKRYGLGMISLSSLNAKEAELKTAGISVAQAKIDLQMSTLSYKNSLAGII